MMPFHFLFKMVYYKKGSEFNLTESKVEKYILKHFDLEFLKNLDYIQSKLPSKDNIQKRIIIYFVAPINKSNGFINYDTSKFESDYILKGSNIPLYCLKICFTICEFLQMKRTILK